MESDIEVTPPAADEPAITDASGGKPIGETTPQPPEGDKPEDKDLETKKVLSGVQKRIDQLTREKYEAQRRADEALAFVERLRQSQQAPKEPQPSDYQDLEAYTNDKAQYLAQQQLAAERARQQEEYQRYTAIQQEQAARAELVQTIARASEEGKKIYPDFDEVVFNPALPKLGEVNPAAFQAILSSDQGVQVAYYLGKNIAEAYRIADLDPISAVREIAKLETRLSVKKTTTAPPPIPSIGGTERAEPDPDKMSTEEWMRWRDKQLRKKKG